MTEKICTDETHTHTHTTSYLIAHTHSTVPRCYGSSNERPLHTYPPINCSSLRNSHKHKCNLNVNTDHNPNVKMCIITLIYPPFFTPVRNHRGDYSPGVSPFLRHVRKKLQRLHPCIGGETSLKCKTLCSGSRPVPEAGLKVGRGAWGRRPHTLQFVGLYGVS